jgi:hypothetical protein
MKSINEMTHDEIAEEIEWNEDIFRSCEESGHGISSKEVVRQARLKAALTMMGDPKAETSFLTQQQIAILRGEYERIETIDPCQPTYDKLCETLDAMPDALLMQIANAEIKFMSLLARNRCNRRNIG